MTRLPRMPGDPAAGDAGYGPLNGLFDDLHHDARRRERERDIEGARLLRDPNSLRRRHASPIAMIRAMTTRVRAWRPPGTAGRPRKRRSAPNDRDTGRSGG